MSHSHAKWELSRPQKDRITKQQQRLINKTVKKIECPQNTLQYCDSVYEATSE